MSAVSLKDLQTADQIFGWEQQQNVASLLPKAKIKQLISLDGEQQYLQRGGPLQDLILQGTVSRNLLQKLSVHGVRGQRLTQHDVVTAQESKL